MSSRAVLVLAIFASVAIRTIFPQTNNNDFLNQKTLNDTLLELFHNCTCTVYPACKHANTNVIDSILTQTNSSVFSNEIKCSNPDYVCCPNEEINEKQTDTMTRNPEVINGCGMSKTDVGIRILTPDDSSAATIPGEFPWVVQIHIKQNSQYVFKCVGTLIHPKVVLTATHCIISNQHDPHTFKVIATGKETFQNPKTNPEDERNVKKIIKYPSYQSRYLHNDISLLILQKEYSFTNRLNSICLPAPNQVFDDRRCLVAGWGGAQNNANASLRKVDVPIINFEKCKQFLKTTKLGSRFNLHPSFTCAGGEEGKDSCKGDGGGPLMCLGEEYEMVQVGIVSWGLRKNCGHVNEPGMYANVAKFTEWIKKELRKESITIN